MVGLLLVSHSTRQLRKFGTKCTKSKEIVSTFVSELEAGLCAHGSGAAIHVLNRCSGGGTVLYLVQYVTEGSDIIYQGVVTNIHSFHITILISCVHGR